MQSHARYKLVKLRYLKTGSIMSFHKFVKFNKHIVVSFGRVLLNAIRRGLRGFETILVDL
jgi:hypothetical protein